MSMKNSNDTIGNRIRDLPAWSSVPQTTGQLRAAQSKGGDVTNILVFTAPGLQGFGNIKSTELARSIF